MRWKFSRAIIVRYLIGSVTGTLLAWSILQFGIAYAIAHTPKEVAIEYFVFYFMSRAIWVMLVGAALGVWGNLIAIRLNYTKDPFPLIQAIGITSAVLTVLMYTFQEILIQEAPFFFDFFWELAINIVFFSMMIIVPFIATMLSGVFLLKFLRPSRPISEIMPPELQAEMQQHKDTH